MTVGELIYQQMKDGYIPTASLSDGFISTVTRTAEESQKLVETMRIPMENMQRTLERIRPSLEAMNNIIPRVAPPFMPSLYEEEDEDLIIPALNRSVQTYVVEDPDAKTESRYLTASYQLPGNAKWELLEMHFIDGHFVRVSYPGMESKKFDFKDMGFMDTRNVQPDRKWVLLRAIAEHRGYLTKEHFDRRLHRNIKYELNERLKRFFGMATSPIPRYTKRDGYMTLFVIRGDQ